MMIGAASVLIYTLFGGMWSVAITDFIQMIIIVIGMLYIGGEMTVQTGGISSVIEHAAAAGQLGDFWPDMNLASILGFVAALCYHDVRLHSSAGCIPKNYLK
jgi:Na+/proline symporter